LSILQPQNNAEARLEPIVAGSLGDDLLGYSFHLINNSSLAKIQTWISRPALNYIETRQTVSYSSDIIDNCP